MFANIFLSCTYWEVFIASRENMHWTMSGSSRFNRWISILNFIDWNFQMQSDAFWKAKNNNFIRKKFQRNLFQHPRAITKKQEKKCHPKLWLNFFLSLFYIYKCNRLSSTNLSVFKNNKYKKKLSSKHCEWFHQNERYNHLCRRKYLKLLFIQIHNRSNLKWLIVRL